ncbi:MAG: DNA primase [Desulfobacterota bacterium]|nr:DNA primase [Thermodesulfobacteriota bacterium]
MTNGFLSPEKIGEIRNRASLLEVVSDYVSLKKAGRNFKGLCPFHAEKTPSFMVNEEKQIFHCFGCGEGGDVFAFLMKAGHLTFVEAARELAKRYGVALPRSEPSRAAWKEGAKRETLFQINQMAADYFHDLLVRRREGEEGRDYLAQRGVSQEVIQEYRLGYASAQWEGLVEHLREKKAPLELAWEVGLILPKRKEGWYDAFRRRIIFPILDLQKRVVGFGGRALGDGQPKYLNSPDSTVYHKGEVLYGLHVARRFIPDRQGAILVEGYFDLLTLHQYGYSQAVATLGTALTAQQIRILKRYTEMLFLVYDSDRPGLQAMLRTLPLLLEEEMLARVVLLPPGEDPDSFLKKGNRGLFEERLARAPFLLDFFFDWLMGLYDPRSIEGRVKIAKEGMAMVQRIQEPVRRALYVRALAERLDLKEEDLLKAVRSVLPPKAPSQGGSREASGSPLPKSEETLIRLMIQHPESIPVISREGILKEFESPLLKRMGEQLESIYQRKGRLELSEVVGEVEEELRERLCHYAFEEGGEWNEASKRILKDCIEKIRRKKLSQDEKDLLRRIQEAERRNTEELEGLLRRRQELARQKELLRSMGRKA